MYDRFDGGVPLKEELTSVPLFISEAATNADTHEMLSLVPLYTLK